MESLDTKQINLFDYHHIFQNEVLLSYKGPFDSIVLSVLAKYIELLVEKDANASRKMFKIFIELAQNISSYSSEVRPSDGAKIGQLAIGETPDHYSLVTGNLISNSDVVPVIEKCEIINSLDRDALRKYKVEQRNLATSMEHSHIGLIQVALTASQPIDLEVVHIDDEFSFFTVSVKVNK